MDLEVIHALAPDAKTVLVNARSTVEGDGGFEKIAHMMDSTQRPVPRRGVEFLDRLGLREAAHRSGFGPGPVGAGRRAQDAAPLAFDASGDLAGLDCKGGQDWSAAPGDDDVGLDAVAAIAGDDRRRRHHRCRPTPAVRGAPSRPGSTRRCPTAPAGECPPCSPAPTGRTAWHRQRGAGQRLTPDIAAASDPFTGVKIVFNQRELAGGGTSQAAPIWAGMAAVMNQYLIAHGGKSLGDLNPLLYRVAAGSPAAGLSRRHPRRQCGRQRRARL